jgi:hypothetical protein
MARQDAESLELKTDAVIQHVDDHPHRDRDDKHGHIEGNAILVNKDGEIRKIPVPSADPNDPLNFRPWEKYGVVFCCCWFSIMGLSLAAGLGTILNTFFEMYGSQGYSAERIVLLITLPTLCIGLGQSCAFVRRYGHCSGADVVLKATTSSSRFLSPTAAGPCSSGP